MTQDSWDWTFLRSVNNSNDLADCLWRNAPLYFQGCICTLSKPNSCCLSAQVLLSHVSITFSCCSVTFGPASGALPNAEQSWRTLTWVLRMLLLPKACPRATLGFVAPVTLLTYGEPGADCPLSTLSSHSPSCSCTSENSYRNTERGVSAQRDERMWQRWMKSVFICKCHQLKVLFLPIKPAFHKLR